MSSAQIAAIAANERIAQLEARVARLEARDADLGRQLTEARAKLPVTNYPEWLVQEEPSGG